MRKLDTSSLAVIILLGGVYFYTHQNGGKFSLLAQIGSGGVASSAKTSTAFSRKKASSAERILVLSIRLEGHQDRRRIINISLF